MTLTECDKLPAVAVTTTVYEPDLTCFFVSSVSTAVPDGSDAGWNVAVTNRGSEPTDSVTFDEKPWLGVIVTLNDVVAPLFIVRLAGDAETEKSPAVLTTSVTFAEWETGPLVPVTCNV